MLTLWLWPHLVSVKEKLTADPDSEVATTSLRVSLMCPVGTRARRRGRRGGMNFWTQMRVRRAVGIKLSGTWGL